MLAIYDVMLGVLREIRGVLAKVEVKDLDLAKQLRRAATSVLLNIAEASGVSGGNRRMRYLTALGSAKETRACLHAAEALGYIGGLNESVVDGLDRIIATLVKVSR